MMTRDELLNMENPGEPPVMLADGRVGLLIGYPFSDQDDCRIQVYGEQEARRLHPSKLNRKGDALYEDGAVLPVGDLGYHLILAALETNRNAKD